MQSKALIGETTLPILNKLCHQFNFSGGTGNLLTLKFLAVALGVLRTKLRGRISGHVKEEASRMEKVHKEECNNLKFLSDVIMVIKSRNMGLSEHLERTETCGMYIHVYLV
jgi:hypothetical protein